MRVVFESFGPSKEISVQVYLKNKKLNKYFNREAAAAIVCMNKLTAGKELPANIPFYYATGVIEHEDYGLKAVAAGSRDAAGDFSQKLFVERGMAGVSPLTQFKVLYNMPLCFVSIEYKLTGDNAVIYSSAQALLLQARHSRTKGDILIGAGKVYSDGTTESGFALLRKTELASLNYPGDTEAIELFRDLRKKEGSL
ncbi:MAG: hypothetical protein PHV60_06670 [bacterium]|nr:hypothetical protein [bacterium]